MRFVIMVSESYNKIINKSYKMIKE